MSFVTKVWAGNSNNRKLLISLAGVLLLYAAFIYGLSTNPPGIYMDEACLSYNGYLISQTGMSESGVSFPLYFQCYTDHFVQFANPTHVYLLAGLYSFVSPSTVSARILAATMVFLSVLLLGLLATRVSKRPLIGVIVTLSAIAMPWFFDLSRLVLETFFYPLCIVLFLYCLYNAIQREKWRLTDNILLAITLALITYSYTIGRLLGPAFAFGLVIFIVNRRVLLDVIKTWVIYFATLIPIIFVYLTNGEAMTKRLREVSYLTAGGSVWAKATTFASAFFQDISPGFLLFEGDPNPRHHVEGMGEIFAVTLLLATVGMIIVVLRHRGEAWWRFISYGLVISVIPGAITENRHHSLRLLAFPIFLIIFTIPALSWLLGDNKQRSSTSELETQQRTKDWRSIVSSISGRIPGKAILTVLLALALLQAVVYQIQFRTTGLDEQRQNVFDAAYPIALEKALEEQARPIYLEDGDRGPAYIHAYWYSVVHGIDLSNFVHLPFGERPPPDSLVLSSNEKCSNCDVVFRKYVYLLYKTRGTEEGPEILLPSNAPIDPNAKIPTVIGSEGSQPGQFSRPRGIATDKNGDFYVADSGNSRIQKFDSNGEFIASFGQTGSGEGQLTAPDGVEIDESGNIFATDAANHRLLKFGPDGQFVKEWNGGPNFGFYGPRGIALGPGKQLYIVDQGRTRIVKFDLVNEEFTSWGKSGTAESEFSSPVGITVGNNSVFVTDAGNNRIQVFDLEGNFIRQWPVATWQDRSENYPGVVFDEQTKHLYVANGPDNNVIVYDIDGNPVEDIVAGGDEKLDSSSGVAILETAKTKSLIVLDMRGAKVFLFSLDKAKKKK